MAKINQIKGDRIEDGTIYDIDIASSANIATSKINGLTTALTRLANTSGTNTGDQDLTGLIHTNRTALDAVSGTNTGDETTSTIKSKLGITTLSGSNTGDETTSTIKSKLGITTLSGSNTGDQTITLTSDVTGSGTGSFATTIANNAVTNAKSAQMGANTYKGNTSSSTANASDISTNTAFNKNYNTDPANVKASGTVSVGSLDLIARADHVHPATSRPSDQATSVLALNLSTQQITGGVNTQILFPTETTDSLVEFATNTFTSKSIQTVLVSSIVKIATGIGNNKGLYLRIFKNNSLLREVCFSTIDGGTVCANISFPVNVTINDTIKMYCQHTDGTKNINLDGTQVLSIIQLY